MQIIETSPWDRAKELVLSRQSTYALMTGDVEYIELEPGVNFFVLALEHLGAITRFSCEGHPYFFYISFVASEQLAREIAKAGFFSVEVAKQEPGLYIIRANAPRLSKTDNGQYVVESWCADENETVLRFAAQAWVSHFRLDVDALLSEYE